MDLPLHPSIVHVPMALALLMPLLAGGVLLAVRLRWMRPRAVVLVAAGQLALVVGALFAMRSGEADEERVEAVVPKAALEAHEDVAAAFTWAAGLVLALALLAAMPFVVRHMRRLMTIGTAVFAGTLVVLALGLRVGHVGGELVYRHGAANALAPYAPGGQIPAGEGAGHERDER